MMQTLYRFWIRSSQRRPVTQDLPEPDSPATRTFRPRMASVADCPSAKVPMTASPRTGRERGSRGSLDIERM
jgi:hypothetical protein